LDILSNSRDNATISLNESNHGSLVVVEAMPTFAFTADESFIHLNYASHGLVELSTVHAVANPVQHEPRGFLSHANITSKLHRTYALLVRGDQIERHEPLLQRQCGVLEDRTNANRERFTAIGTLEQFATFEGVDFPEASAVRTYNLISPSNLCQILMADLFGREVSHEVEDVSELRMVFHCNHSPFFVLV
jgi:hypothetical protein